LKRLAIILPSAKPAAAANQSHSVANLIISGVLQKQLNLSPALIHHTTLISPAPYQGREQSCKKENGWRQLKSAFPSQYVHRKKNLRREIDHRLSPLFSHLARRYNYINTYRRAEREKERWISRLSLQRSRRESCSRLCSNS
jgi:hypothetical protein